MVSGNITCLEKAQGNGLNAKTVALWWFTTLGRISEHNFNPS